MKAHPRRIIMSDDIKAFVLLKYEILTSDRSTWPSCEATYPVSVKSKWAWRCAADVEHLATGHPEAEECIRIAKLYRDGKATMEKLDKAWNKVPYSAVASASYYTAATASYYAATSTTGARAVRAAISNREERWKLYIGWLIEELCEYEGTSTENINDGN